jgi:hypothetical protein
MRGAFTVLAGITTRMKMKKISWKKLLFSQRNVRQLQYALNLVAF